MFTHQIHQQSSNYTDSRQILKEIELFGPHRLMFEWNFPSLGANKANEKSMIKSRKIRFTSVERGFPVKSSVRTARVFFFFFTEKLLYRCHERVECMNVEFARRAMKFSHTSSGFVDVRCRERSGILLRGPDRKKPDRLAANQSARFPRIPDRKNIKYFTRCSVLRKVAFILKLGSALRKVLINPKYSNR